MSVGAAVRVAVVGHIEWVDFVSVTRMPLPGEVLHASGAFARAAGGGGVVAGVLADLDAEVDFFTALGRDPHGEAAAAQLEERGVRMHVAWRDEPTRRAVTLLEGRGERTIVTVGERLQPLGADELAWERLREADGVYVTAGDAAALASARQARVLVASPRARGALEDVSSAGNPVDRADAVGRARGVGAAAPAAPILDALVFSARDEDERAWAERVSHRFRLLVATDGAHGGTWWGESSGRWNPAPVPGEPHDSYGCGDSFAAAFTYGLAAGLSVEEAAGLGARYGARCLTRAGAP